MKPGRGLDSVPELEVSEAASEYVSRVAALDIGKAELTACVRVPAEGSGSGSRRQQMVRSYPTLGT